jgi:hypothetical protein
VAFVYGGVSGALLLVIATVALVLVPPSPPGLAEFAPSPHETIEDAPDSQASRFGSGAGACPPGMVCDPLTGEVVARAGVRPPGQPLEKTRVRRCVGDPPSQTEDPQSPPCVNYFEGDNGGPTTKGVTRDEIRVAYPHSASMDANKLAILHHFNSRYELYGRQLRLIRTENPDNRRDPAVQRALAATIDTEVDAFASLELWAMQEQAAFRSELARRRILWVGGDSGDVTAMDMQSHRPYLWSYAPPLDGLQSDLAEMACKSLVGRSASYAGPEFVASQRTFAVLRPKSTGRPMTVDPLISGLGRCGAQVKLREWSTDDVALVVAELRSSGTTTVIPLGDRWGPVWLQAGTQGYQPEWLVMPGMILEYEDWSMPWAQHMFGLFSRNKLVAFSDDPYFWAIRETNGDFQPGPYGNLESFYSEFYRQLLPLVSGIQMAGPRLDAASFERGLQSARFSNPRAGGPPYWQATVGFGPGDYSMVDDSALFWWDPGQRKVRGSASGDQTGTYCYINQGQRWGSGGWPEGPQPFFDRTRPCR